MLKVVNNTKTESGFTSIGENNIPSNGVYKVISATDDYVTVTHVIIEDVFAICFDAHGIYEVIDIENCQTSGLIFSAQLCSAEITFS